VKNLNWISGQWGKVCIQLMILRHFVLEKKPAAGGSRSCKKDKFLKGPGLKKERQDSRLDATGGTEQSRSGSRAGQTRFLKEENSRKKTPKAGVQGTLREKEEYVWWKSNI